jgi:hypothetical protein
MSLRACIQECILTVHAFRPAGKEGELHSSHGKFNLRLFGTPASAMC